MVAVEQRFLKDQRIITDDLAQSILPFGVRASLWLIRSAAARDWIVRSTEKSFPGLWAGMMCRKRYIDEKLIESVASIDAVVNLGAGFDTRVYRLPAVAKVPAWEVDQAENIDPKRSRLRKLFGAVPPHVTLVSIDFDREQLATALASAGYTASKRTFFIWEAVSQYLTETGIRTTFDFLASTARGSCLAFTYVRKDFLDGQNLYGQQRLYDRYVAKDKIWVFGIDPEGVENFLKPYGWRVVEHLGYEALAERYVRPTGRVLASTPIERMVYAEKV